MALIQSTGTPTNCTFYVNVDSVEELDEDLYEYIFNGISAECYGKNLEEIVPHTFFMTSNDKLSTNCRWLILTLTNTTNEYPVKILTENGEHYTESERYIYSLEELHDINIINGLSKTVDIEDLN